VRREALILGWDAQRQCNTYMGLIVAVAYHVLADREVTEHEVKNMDWSWKIMDGLASYL